MALRTGDVLLRTLYLGTALLGLLFSPPMTILYVIPVLTVGSVLLLAGFLCYVTETVPSRGTLTSTAVIAATLVPFAEGVAALQGLGQVVGIAVLALLTITGTSRIADLADRATRPPTTGPAATAPARTGPSAAGGEQALRTLLGAMPLAALCAEWRLLQHTPARRVSASDRERAVQTRTLLLDEMQRRDAEGFATWLATGATAPPEAHLRDDQGQPA